MNELQSIAEFNRIVLNYKKMKAIDEFCENSAKKHNEKVFAQGWQCPVCGKVYSPYVTECKNAYCGLKTWTGTTINVLQA